MPHSSCTLPVGSSTDKSRAQRISVIMCSIDATKRREILAVKRSRPDG
jgi:hypothetical protein